MARGMASESPASQLRHCMNWNCQNFRSLRCSGVSLGGSLETSARPAPGSRTRSSSVRMSHPMLPGANRSTRKHRKTQAIMLHHVAVQIERPKCKKCPFHRYFLQFRSPIPAGYTICLGPIGALAITSHMVAKLPYDIERDFQPIALATRGHLLLAVSPTLPFKSVQDIIDYAKANPGKLLNASSSNGSPGHVGGELFKYMSGTDIVHVPYRGGAAAINDLIAGRVHLMFESLHSIAPHARSGAVRALAVSGARRSPGFPELPTVAEAGVPGYAAPTWSGVIAPAGVSRPIIDKLNAAINKAIGSQSFKDRFATIGDEPAGGTPEEFAELIRTDSAKWGEVVRRSGARLD